MKKFLLIAGFLFALFIGAICWAVGSFDWFLYAISLFVLFTIVAFLLKGAAWLFSTVPLLTIAIIVSAATGSAFWVLYVIGAAVALAFIAAVIGTLSVIALNMWVSVRDLRFERKQNKPLRKAGIDPDKYWTQVRLNPSTGLYEQI